MNDNKKQIWQNFHRYGAITLLFLLGFFFLQQTSTPQKGSLNQSVCQLASLTTEELAKYHGLPTGGIALLQENGYSAEQICAMTEAELISMEFLEDYITIGAVRPDHPEEAMIFRMEQLKNENGIIPENAYLDAYQHVELMKATQEADGKAPDALTWTWLGPGNIGGRLRSIVIHPTSTNTMWAASIAGGIWKTTDGGASWAPVDDFMGNLAVTTIIMDPTNSNVMYAGTGEGFYNVDALRGAGVFKSTDGGSTWAQLASTNNSNWYYVNRLAISPNGATILAATRSGVYRSTDGGASWVQELTADTADVDFHPSDSNKAVIGLRDGGVAGYTNDGGLNWAGSTFASGTSGRVEIAYAPSSPTTVYVSMNQNSGEIWRSVNGGANFSLMNTGTQFLSGQGWYDNALWVDPTNANTLIAGGVDLYRSTNSGTALTQITQWWQSTSAHADHHFIVAHPNFNGTSNKTVFFGNDGGIYKANDVYTVSPTSGWQELNNNLGVTQFYGAAGNAITGRIVGGAQDNGTLFYTGGTETWNEIFGGDGGYAAADPNDSNYFYGEYTNLNIHRNSSNGASQSEYISGNYWNGSSWVWKNPPYRIDDSMNGTASFISPFVLDPNNANRLLGGGVSLWRTNDVKTVNTNTTGPTWSTIKASVGSNISAIAIAQGNSDIIWVGHKNGLIYRTSNGTSGTPTWTRVDDASMPGRIVTRLTIDANNNNIAYATFSGFDADNVWRTADNGTSWTDITGAGGTGLPDVPVRSLVIDPSSSSKLYVGTEVGVFASADTGATWTAEKPANVSVDELFWMGTKLVAATHGRGLYSAETSAACTPPSPATNVTATRNGASVNLTWTAGAGAETYEVWRKPNDFYFTANTGTMLISTAGTSYTDSTGTPIGDPANNYSYVIIAKKNCGAEATPSDRAGEFDFGITPGGGGGPQTYTYDDIPAGGVPITSSTCGGSEIIRTFNVADTFTIGDINVGFNADHTYRGDLVVTLQSPTGTQKELISSDGGDGNANYDVLLDGDSGGVIDNDIDDDTGMPYYDRTVMQTLLNDFDGEAANGSWTLTICDSFVGDEGTYNRSQLTFTSN